MAQPIDTGLPENLDLDQDYTLRFIALDATAGTEVTTVTIENASFTAAPLGQTTAEDLQVGPYMLVPGPAS